MKRLISSFLVLFALVSCELLPVINHDEAQLRGLFLTTGGKDWTCNTNWCGYKPIGEWYGVEAEDGNVVSLDLADNNLTGDLSLYDMAMLKNLDLSGNDFRDVVIGNIPLNELKMEYVSCNKLYINYHTNTDKVIREVNLRNCKKLGQVIVNDVKELNISGCTISDLDITDWHSGNTTIVLQNVTLTGHLGGITIDYDKLDSAGEFHEKYKDGKYEDPDEEYYDKSELRIRLEELYSSAGGDRWYKRTNWCSDKPLDQWYGVTLDKDGQLIGLNLSDNNLTGRLYIEEFTFLKELNVSNNNFESIHISNTPMADVVLENCLLGLDYNRNSVNISGVSKVYLKGNSIWGLDLIGAEKNSSIESVEIIDCIVGYCFCDERCSVGELKMKNTTIMSGVFDPTAERMIIEDSEILEYFYIGSADVQLTNCLIGFLNFETDMKSIVMNHVVLGQKGENCRMCDGSADGYHNLNKLINQATPIAKYTNDNLNLRCLLYDNMELSRQWPLSKPINEWNGVTTDARGRVTALDLSSLDLKYLDIFCMGYLSDLVTNGNKFRKIKISGTSIRSLDLSNIVSSEAEEIRLSGIKTIIANNLKNMPEINVDEDSVCVYINNCDFGKGQPISGNVKDLVIKNSQMERLSGNADNAQVESCIMASCDIRTKYCTIKDSEVYSSMSMDFDNELHIINSSITNPETYWSDGLIYLNNATFKKNGVSKTFTSAAMNIEQFRKLLKDNGLE